MTMDLQIALVSVGFCVLSGLVVYLVSVFGMKEKTYEEAIEEQRRRNQEALQLTKTDKPTKKDKKFKKASKANKASANNKDKTEASLNPDQQPPQHPVGGEAAPSSGGSGHHAGGGVDFKTETEIIPSESDPEQNGDRKSSKSRKKNSKSHHGAPNSASGGAGAPREPPKSILVNKLTTADSVLASQMLPEVDDDYSMTEPPAPAFVPLDEVERRHSLDAGTMKRMSATFLTSANPALFLQSLVEEPTPLASRGADQHKSQQNATKSSSGGNGKSTSGKSAAAALSSSAATATPSVATLNNDSSTTDKKKDGDKKKVKDEETAASLPPPSSRLSTKDDSLHPATNNTTSNTNNSSNSGPSPTKKNKKNKNDENSHKDKSVDDEANRTPAPLSTKKMVSWLKSSALQDDEIQLLIDVLLNKQHGTQLDHSGNTSSHHSSVTPAPGGGLVLLSSSSSSSSAPSSASLEWTKKNDPVAALKKQLQERDATLEAEQRQTVAINAKLREMRHELSQEKNRYTANERTFKDKMTQQQQEIQGLHARLQHSIEQHLAESNALQGKLQQMQSKVSDEHNMALQHISEENVKLQQKLSRFDADRQKWTSVENQLQMKVKQLQSACERYEATQVGQQVENDKLEGRIAQLMSSGQEDEYKYGRSMAEISQKAAETESRYNALLQEAARAQSVASAASDADRNELIARLEQTETAARKLENDVQQLHEERERSGVELNLALGQCEQAQATANEAMERKDALAQENLRLQNELANQQQRLLLVAANGTELLAANNKGGGGGQQQQQYKENHVTSVNTSSAATITATPTTTTTGTSPQEPDYLSILKSKETEVSSLESSLQRQKSFLATVSQDLESQKKKNNELREKNWKAMDALTEAEKALKARQEQLDGILQDQQDTKEAQLRKMAQLTQDAQDKVERAQRAAQQLAEQVQQEQRQERQLLAQLLPQDHFDPQADHKKWLDQFISSTRQKLTVVSITSPTPPSSPGGGGGASSTARRSSSDEDDSADTKGEIKAVAETEVKLIHLKAENSSLQAQINHYKTVLAETEDILKKLQSGVEAEEAKWKDKLSTAEDKLEKATREKKTLEKNLEELQGIEEATSEMQTRLKELQAKLQGEENEKRNLEQKFDQASKTGDELAKQLEEKNAALEKLRLEKEDLMEAQKELETIRGQLEKERKTSKDLSSQTVKLTSLIRIGQDALKAEQELVKELQRQIDLQLKDRAAAGDKVLPGSHPGSPSPVLSTVDSHHPLHRPTPMMQQTPFNNNNGTTPTKNGGVVNNSNNGGTPNGSQSNNNHTINNAAATPSNSASLANSLNQSESSAPPLVAAAVASTTTTTAAAAANATAVKSDKPSKHKKRGVSGKK